MTAAEMSRYEVYVDERLAGETEANGPAAAANKILPGVGGMLRPMEPGVFEMELEDGRWVEVIKKETKTGAFVPYEEFARTNELVNVRARSKEEALEKGKAQGAPDDAEVFELNGRGRPGPAFETAEGKLWAVRWKKQAREEFYDSLPDCETCNGKGEVRVNAFVPYEGEDWVNCTACEGTGKDVDADMDTGKQERRDAEDYYYGSRQLSQAKLQEKSAALSPWVEHLMQCDQCGADPVHQGNWQARCEEGRRLKREWEQKKGRLMFPVKSLVWNPRVHRYVWKTAQEEEQWESSLIWNEKTARYVWAATCTYCDSPNAVVLVENVPRGSGTYRHVTCPDCGEDYEEPQDAKKFLKGKEKPPGWFAKKKQAMPYAMWTCPQCNENFGPLESGWGSQALADGHKDGRHWSREENAAHQGCKPCRSELDSRSSSRESQHKLLPNYTTCIECGSSWDLTNEQDCPGCGLSFEELEQLVLPGRTRAVEKFREQLKDWEPRVAPDVVKQREKKGAQNMICPRCKNPWDLEETPYCEGCGMSWSEALDRVKRERPVKEKKLGPPFVQSAKGDTGAGGWPLVPSERRPGESALACPKCGSTDVTQGGAAWGAWGLPVDHPSQAEFNRCESCGFETRYPPKRMSSRGKIAASCPDCHGSGDCMLCEGTGNYRGWSRSRGRFGPECPDCLGKGACPRCKGSGKTAANNDAKGVRELQCNCGKWIKYPGVGEIVQCDCGQTFETREDKKSMIRQVIKADYPGHHDEDKSRDKTHIKGAPAKVNEIYHACMREKAGESGVEQGIAKSDKESCARIAWSTYEKMSKAGWQNRTANEEWRQCEFCGERFEEEDEWRLHLHDEHPEEVAHLGKHRTAEEKEAQEAAKLATLVRFSQEFFDRTDPKKRFAARVRDALIMSAKEDKEKFEQIVSSVKTSSRQADIVFNVGEDQEPSEDSEEEAESPEETVNEITESPALGDIEALQEMGVACDRCVGSGICPICQGQGIVDPWVRRTCGNCGGSGSCPGCEGVGLLGKPTKAASSEARKGWAVIKDNRAVVWEDTYERAALTALEMFEGNEETGKTVWQNGIPKTSASDQKWCAICGRYLTKGEMHDQGAHQRDKQKRDEAKGPMIAKKDSNVEVQRIESDERGLGPFWNVLIDGQVVDSKVTTESEAERRAALYRRTRQANEWSNHCPNCNSTLSSDVKLGKNASGVTVPITFYHCAVCGYLGEKVASEVHYHIVHEKPDGPSAVIGGAYNLEVAEKHFKSYGGAVGITIKSCNEWHDYLEGSEFDQKKAAPIPGPGGKNWDTCPVCQGESNLPSSVDPTPDYDYGEWDPTTHERKTPKCPKCKGFGWVETRKKTALNWTLDGKPIRDGFTVEAEEELPFGPPAISEENWWEGLF